MKSFWHPEFRLGVLGGGQLGRMLLPYATRAGLNLAFLDPDPEAPCARAWPDFTQGSLQDKNTVIEFGKKCDLLTIEIEQVNVDALEYLESTGVVVQPSSQIIRMVQDKYIQKKFYKDNGFPTAEFVKIDKPEDLKNHISMLPAVQKIRKGGYDGKGVFIIESEKDIKKAIPEPSILENKVFFKKELSVIVARSGSGEMKTYPIVEMEFHHNANLVEFVLSPAKVKDVVNTLAIDLAKTLAEKLKLEGVLAVEMFLTQSENLIINEISPRPHNSGHHTIEACVTSQYEQHLRAILGFTLGSTELKSPSVMLNILGAPGHTGLADYSNLSHLFSIPNAHLHLYGKKETRPFRKMGHLTITAPDIKKARNIANNLKQDLKITSLKDAK